MTIILFIAFLLAIYFAVKNLGAIPACVLMGKWIMAIISAILAVVWAIIAILIWVRSLKDRLTGE